MAEAMVQQRHREGARSAISQDNRQSMRRVIVKQGYLKKIPNSAKIGSSLKKADRRWFVFGVMNGKDPYLEYYNNEERVFSASPLNIIFLETCNHILMNKLSSRYEHVFTLVLQLRQLSLVAPSKQTMIDWANTIEEKLVELGHMSEVNHDYVTLPQPSPQTSHPLPPPTVEEDDSLLENQANAANENHETYGTLWDTSSSPAPPSLPASRQHNVSTPALQMAQRPSLTPINLQPLSPSSEHPPLHTLPSFEESMAMSPPYSPPVGAVGGFENPSSPEGGFSVLSPKMREAFGLDDSGNPGDDAVDGWNMPPPEDNNAPPPYLPKRVLERNANKSLKMTQVEALRREMLCTSGVQLILRRIDCHHALALVDCMGAVWIAGWNQRARPFLNNAIHVGDQLISIHGQVVETAKMAHKLMKHCEDDEKLTFVVRRMPHGKVFAIRRLIEGEELGIYRNGGTAEIVTVHPEGLAGQHGLTSKAICASGDDDFCNWCLTEINNRPLSMFFKDNEIEHRLNAVGRDISIVVHPLDFITELKKCLKAMYKNYKDFLVQ